MDLLLLVVDEVAGVACPSLTLQSVITRRTLCFRARIDKSIISFTNQIHLYWRKIMYLPVCFLQFQPCVLVWDVSLIYSSLWMFYRIMNKDMDVLLQMNKVKWKYVKYNKTVLVLNFRRICNQVAYLYAFYDGRSDVDFEWMSFRIHHIHKAVHQYEQPKGEYW